MLKLSNYALFNKISTLCTKVIDGKNQKLRGEKQNIYEKEKMRESKDEVTIDSKSCSHTRKG